ncbi:MAG: hypothetical protein JWR19_937 [Pedosphaera sp.]|nr:hypothetical protein [Pedosphaera sp.]
MPRDGTRSATPEDARKRRVCLVAWFLKDSRRWLGEHLDPDSFECSYISSSMKVDIRNQRTSPKVWLGFFLLALKARWHLLWHKHDVIVSAFPQLGMMLGLINLLTFERTPHIIWYFNCGHQYKGLRLRVSQWIFRHIERFIVYSNAEKRNYAKWFNLPEERFRFTYLTGPELSRKKYHGAKARYGLPDRYIASLGSSGRDFKTLFAAAASLGVATVVVSHRYALAGLTVPPSVTVLESVPQEDFLAVIAEADLVVLALDNVETASGQMTLIQAMGLGVPVVATRCIGTEDYIRDGVNGYLVPMGDVARLHDTMKRLVDQPGLRARAAESALTFARQNFYDAAGARVLENICSEIFGSPAPQSTLPARPASDVALVGAHEPK